MWKRLRQFWLMTTIKQKIVFLTSIVMSVIFLSVFLDIWVIRFSLVDFNTILEDNVKCSDLIACLEEESALFEAYMKNTEDEPDITELSAAMERTNQAVESLPFVYNKIGEIRYARTWSLCNCYEVYQEKRDVMLQTEERNSEYIRNLYEVYEIQDYLQDYAQSLMAETLEVGSVVYQRKIPMLVSVPFFVVVIGVLLFYAIFKLANLMYKTIVAPVMRLAGASKKIAANEYFIADVEVENEDEIGELVHAFNKMKYATGEYITALEEKRKTLDLLHAHELEKLETEKRLEMIKLELLKNQIRPHFLFNTLNVIGGMANLEDAETTERMIKSLSALFRYNLKTPEAEVSLAQELKVVNDYMYLQQMRFGSRIAYEIDCRVDTEKILVPTFTFQPLVENAIIHGLSPKEEGGKIRIRIWQRAECLHITVADTGVGMESSKLEEIRGRLKNEADGRGGIGVSNVFGRIDIMYEGSSVDVHSRKGIGTVVAINIPQMEGMDVSGIGGG